ncbi:hypothetical protein [Pseudonocardia oroxyli]|uniref:Uncharacterized protein n=1 Tax=Pseudonocardia oroxyli TaxID=366584 RepID=A0A1G7XDF8_PSEOR|nr:hypothetical protein [Pseudonocardia oroxyli]SDG82272.1 hypothetical protein SAMN05216377_115165 [Pseudonocardia oroxyli]
MPGTERSVRRLAPSEPPPWYPLLGLELGETIQSAVYRAITGLEPGTALGTGALLAALDAADGGGAWERFWLLVGLGGPERVGELRDPDGLTPLLDARPGARLDGVRLTPALTASLTLLRDLVRDFELGPVPPGALAIALVAEPTSAVVSLLTADGERSRSELLELAQDQLLGTSLDGLEVWVEARFNTSTQEPTVEEAIRRARGAAAGENRRADDIDLLDELVTGLESSAPRAALPRLLRTVLPAATAPARVLGTRPLDDVVAESSDRPDAWQLLDKLASGPSRGCAAVFAAAGLTGPGVMADARRARRADGGIRLPATGTYTAVALANMVLVGLVIAVVVVHALGPGSPWELFAVPFLFYRMPADSPVVPAAMVVVLVLVSSPLAAGLNLLSFGTGWMQTRLEMRRLRAVTGVGLTLREYTGHLRRTLRPAFVVRRAALLSAFRIARFSESAAG